MLLRADAETDKRDGDGVLAIDLAPDKKVCQDSRIKTLVARTKRLSQTRDFILRSAEREGIEIAIA